MSEKKDWKYYNKIDPHYEKEGHFRIAPTADEQLQTLFNQHYIYCSADNLIFYLEKWTAGFKRYDGTKNYGIDYDNPQENCTPKGTAGDPHASNEWPLSDGRMIPLSICGIKGNEFEDWSIENRRHMKISGNMIKVIDGEEQEILLGHLKGDGSEILYS